MGLLSGRRERKRQEQVQAEADTLALIHQGVADSRAMHLGADGEYDLRGLVRDVWEGAPTHAVQLIKRSWNPGDGRKTGDGFYEAEFQRHWDGLDQRQREQELLTIIQFMNRFVVADSDDPHAQVVGSLLQEKSRLLATAYDAQYGTDFAGRTFSDAMQFGV